MPRRFYHATAEQAVAAVEAVQVNGPSASSFVERFCDLSPQQAASALSLAEDLKLLDHTSGKYHVSNPLAKFITTPDEKRKASVFRIVLESYEPFIIFRDRLTATNSADAAALQTKVKLDLDAHREEIKDTLISLGTFASALRALGAGRYMREDDNIGSHLLELAKACGDVAAGEARIRIELGDAADIVSRSDVLVPLSSALLKAAAGKSEEAVTEGGKAVESFLVELAARLGVILTGASGIGQKLDKFRTNNELPKKIVEAAKYLAHVRNAADHGRDIDPDVNAVWKIQKSTALQYVYVACSFIVACHQREHSGPFLL
jgi:hypothetical protein